MLYLGFFAQLPHGHADGPDLILAIGRETAVHGAHSSDPQSVMDPGMRCEIARYLRGCPVVVATSQRVDDVVDPSKHEVSGINIHTDGTYLWPEDLAYYVEAYGVAVPDEIVAAAHHGIPDLDADAMGEVVAWLQSRIIST